jgi:hypothetical protein
MHDCKRDIVGANAPSAKSTKLTALYCPDRTAYNKDRTSKPEETYAAVWRSYSLDELY